MCIRVWNNNDRFNHSEFILKELKGRDTARF